MIMDLETLRALFSANLDPIKTDIKELKDGQLQIIEIIKVQTRQETEINNIQKDVDECADNVEKMKETGNSRLWEISKLGIAGFIGAILARFF